jgi:hypothetical protein
MTGPGLKRFAVVIEERVDRVGPPWHVAGLPGAEGEYATGVEAFNAVRKAAPLNSVVVVEWVTQSIAGWAVAQAMGAQAGK